MKTKTETTDDFLFLVTTCAIWIGMAAIAFGFSGCGDNVEPPLFNRHDHDICVFWPDCPEGVVASGDHSKLRAFPNQCREEFKIQISCGACVDTRTPSCTPYVGHCKAPNWPEKPVDYCEGYVPAPRPVLDAWTICTGPTNGADGGEYARVVCED